MRILIITLNRDVSLLAFRRLETIPIKMRFTRLYYQQNHFLSDTKIEKAKQKSKHWYKV